MQPVIVYDLETKKTFAEVGGHGKNHELGVSFLGLYSYTQDKYFSFFEKDLPKLETILQAEKPVVVGFNSISFDNVVIQPYFQSLQISSLPQVDILADIYRTLGFRMKLESVAQATLAEGKSGSGLDAIKYYREGNFGALEKYCLDDVRITKLIYDYGCLHGYILYTSGGESYRMPVQWSTQPTLFQQLTEIFQQHKQVELQVLKVTEQSHSTISTKTDILELNDKTVTVYSYLDNDRQSYALDRILGLKKFEETSAYQVSLF